jgi:hypothetical protein
MKKVLLAVFLFLFATNGFCQTARVSSIKEPVTVRGIDAVIADLDAIILSLLDTRTIIDNVISATLTNTNVNVANVPSVTITNTNINIVNVPSVTITNSNVNIANTPNVNNTNINTDVRVNSITNVVMEPSGIAAQVKGDNLC